MAGLSDPVGLFSTTADDVGRVGDLERGRGGRVRRVTLFTASLTTESGETGGEMERGRGMASGGMLYVSSVVRSRARFCIC